jgi:TP53 regulating kinase and related kinases
VLLKHRFSKRYRHSTLDANLTRARVAGEARALLRCLRCAISFQLLFDEGLRSLYSCGVSVPGLRFVDVANGVLGIEWVNGRSVRFLLGSGDEGEDADGDEDVVEDPLIEYGVSKGTISHDVHSWTPIFLMGGEQKY